MVACLCLVASKDQFYNSLRIRLGVCTVNPFSQDFVS